MTTDKLLPHLLLKLLAPLWVNAVLATVVQLAQLATQVAMVAMVLTACQESQETVVPLPHQPQN